MGRGRQSKSLKSCIPRNVRSHGITRLQLIATNVQWYIYFFSVDVKCESNKSSYHIISCIVQYM